MVACMDSEEWDGTILDDAVGGADARSAGAGTAAGWACCVREVADVI